MDEKKKRGRPAGQVLSVKIDVRLSLDTARILDMYCEQKKIVRSEAIRRAVDKLKDEIKNTD